MATKKPDRTKPAATKKRKPVAAKPAAKKARAKKPAGEESVRGYPTKQSFVKVVKNRNKKNPRTWVMIYRLVDGPAVAGTKKRKRVTAE